MKKKKQFSWTYTFDTYLAGIWHKNTGYTCKEKLNTYQTNNRSYTNWLKTNIE